MESMNDKTRFFPRSGFVKNHFAKTDWFCQYPGSCCTALSVLYRLRRLDVNLESSVRYDTAFQDSMSTPSHDDHSVTVYTLSLRTTHP